MRPIAATIVLLLLLGGCAARRAALPEHPLVEPAETGRSIAERAAAVRSVEAACTVILRDDGGDRAVLDGALVAEIPARLRLRAWKLGTPVLDVTLNGDGLWVASAGRGGDDPTAALRAEDIVGAWSLLDGRYFAADLAVRRVTDDEIVYEGAPDAQGWRVRAVIDRPTRTVRRYVVCDAAGAALRTIELDRHRVVDGFAWPHRLRLEGGEGRITIEMRDVRLNEPPLEHAFEPPRDAVRRR